MAEKKTEKRLKWATAANTLFSPMISPCITQREPLAGTLNFSVFVAVMEAEDNVASAFAEHHFFL